MGQPKIVIYQDEGGGWSWHCVASNNEIVAQGESHTTEADARRAASTAADLMDQATPDE